MQFILLLLDRFLKHLLVDEETDLQYISNFIDNCLFSGKIKRHHT